jgi:putative NIF3 family GTP cyclohydrolase 1 type 2
LKGLKDKKITVQDVLNKLIEPVGHLESTVDTLKNGSPEMKVKGIVTTFMATHKVLQKAIALGANLVQPSRKNRITGTRSDISRNTPAS